MILVVGRDVALLEGISQALASVGHPVRTATSLEEARDVAPAHGFDVAVVQRALLEGTEPVPIRLGGVLVLFRAQEERSPRATLSPSLARLLLAEVELPLERYRLVALIRATLARMRPTDRSPTPPDGGERGAPTDA
jgi:CheY-like chemotaxis protein